jgi:hypothetical protein
MSLMEALNSRIGTTERIVPAAAVAVPPPLLTGVGDPAAIRETVPGEVGHKSMKMYPEIEYNIENLTAILTRANKGTEYLLGNLGTTAGEEQVGLLCEILEAAQCMLIAHMASGILSRD